MNSGLIQQLGGMAPPTGNTMSAREVAPFVNNSSNSFGYMGSATPALMASNNGNSNFNYMGLTMPAVSMANANNNNNDDNFNYMGAATPALMANTNNNYVGTATSGIVTNDHINHNPMAMQASVVGIDNLATGAPPPMSSNMATSWLQQNVNYSANTYAANANNNSCKCSFNCNGNGNGNGNSNLNMGTASMQGPALAPTLVGPSTQTGQTIPGSQISSSSMPYLEKHPIWRSKYSPNVAVKIYSHRQQEMAEQLRAYMERKANELKLDKRYSHNPDALKAKLCRLEAYLRRESDIVRELESLPAQERYLRELYMPWQQKFLHCQVFPFVPWVEANRRRKSAAARQEAQHGTEQVASAQTQQEPLPQPQEGASTSPELYPITSWSDPTTLESQDPCSPAQAEWEVLPQQQREFVSPDELTLISPSDVVQQEPQQHAPKDGQEIAAIPPAGFTDDDFIEKILLLQQWTQGEEQVQELTPELSSGHSSEHEKEQNQVEVQVEVRDEFQGQTDDHEFGD
ncbi:hypothetical protein GMORB2_6570 [Geosmithia morbida]|uniref:Uncharacterized protein n=1 Tax=Geosmithia morbida TaxID=1094350 RepID=A0A9P4YWD5_9HYPO|nr:uncharacterized protein GMORB2_6570 [Geosmithia morbida]KAF4123022.1 hypothetical protein GMORB2_6570 [Geosmithia morbida]